MKPDSEKPDVVVEVNSDKQEQEVNVALKEANLDGQARVVKTVLDRSQQKDAAMAVGTSMVLARTIDDMLVILNDGLKVGQKPYMRTCIEQAIKAGMAQDRTYAIRLRAAAAKNGTEKELIPAQPMPVSPEIVTICGSTRFSKEMLETASELELQGKMVLAWRTVVERDSKSHNVKIRVPGHDDEEQHKKMVELHKRKIDISDTVLVVNPKLKAKDKYGYIGESTAQEIVYAHMSKKPVAALEDLPPMEEIIKIAGLTLVEKKEVAV